jgi:A/G-specific adenine glycosylase
MKNLSKTPEGAFTRSLKKWNLQNDRAMPWKGEKDPYKVWLSEIIMQQTRVAQGTPYYERFVRHYPTVRRLADAPDEEVFRLWQGLGYYNRCKNMLAAARRIAARGGKFPDTYEEILELPGVGVYTAAAIASFAFGLPHAVVDGNVQRVLSRYFGITAEVDSTEGKRTVSGLADRVLDREAPGTYNQAIMDFGAEVCTPQKPDCGRCPLAPGCYAKQNALTEFLPRKAPRARPRERCFDYWVPRYGDQVYLRRRGKGDIWQNLHEFLLLEPGHEPENSAILEALSRWGTPEEGPAQGPYRQQLTHQVIHATFREFILAAPPALLTERGFFPVEINGLQRYAFPKTILRYLEIRGWTG